VTKPLRDRQKQFTKEAILTALAEHMAAERSLDFSIADVATRAGVSPRTIYNYFGDRDGLIRALSLLADARMSEQGGTTLPETLAALPELVPPNYRAMEAVSALAEAFARLDHPSELPGHSGRTQGVVELVHRQHPHLPEGEAAAIGIMIRQLASSSMWHRLTREHGLSTDHAAAVAAWTMRLQVEALDRGDLPEFPQDDRS
jgi:AcrR family transcriptional regulator